jgi:hypothetical protein
MKPIALALILTLVPTLAFAGHWAEKGRGPTKITVTIHSMPEGATVYANDARTPMGHTPVDLEYALDGSTVCQIRQGMAVQWTSGAKAEIASLQLCPSTGKHQQYTFTRPTDAPDAAIDESLALQREQLTALKRMQRDQAIANAFQAFQTGFQNGFYNTYLRRPVSCYTSRIGRQWFTRCY